MSYPPLRLISHKLCPFVQRALIVMAERGIPHELKFVNMGEKPDWLLRISPAGEVPVLCVEGKPLFDSMAIIEYLNDISGGSLHPEDPYERARNRAWIELASSAQMTVGSLRAAKDEDVFEIHVATLRRRFASAEQELSDGPFFNGSQLALVDAAFAPIFRYLAVVDPDGKLGFFDGLDKLNRWRKALAKRPSVKQAVVEDYAERLLAFVASKDTVLGHFVGAAPSIPP